MTLKEHITPPKTETLDRRWYNTVGKYKKKVVASVALFELPCLPRKDRGNPQLRSPKTFWSTLQMSVKSLELEL